MKYKIGNIIIVFLIISIILWIVADEYANLMLKRISEYSTKDLSIVNNIKTNEIVKEYPKEDIVKEYKGYDVVAKLEIPKIDLETYVLKNFSESALNVSVTKFWGVEPNTARKYLYSRT